MRTTYSNPNSYLFVSNLNCRIDDESKNEFCFCDFAFKAVLSFIPGDNIRAIEAYAFETDCISAKLTSKFDQPSTKNMFIRVFQEAIPQVSCSFSRKI